MEWTKSKVLSLVNMYRDRPVLWDSRIQEYKDRDKRHEALFEISQSLSTTKEEIERKIKNLLSHFARERKREKMTNKSGCGSRYSSKWFAYSAMLFLIERSKTRKSSTAEGQVQKVSEVQGRLDADVKKENEDTEPSSENVHHKHHTRVFTSPEKTAKRPRLLYNTGVIQDEVITAMKSTQPKTLERDEFTVFGEQVAIRIRKLPSPHARHVVQHIINNTLFEAEMGNYNDPSTLHYAEYQPPYLSSPTSAPSTSMPSPQYNTPSAVQYSGFQLPSHTHQTSPTSTRSSTPSISSQPELE